MKKFKRPIEPWSEPLQNGGHLVVLTVLKPFPPKRPKTIFVIATKNEDGTYERYGEMTPSGRFRKRENNPTVDKKTIRKLKEWIVAWDVMNS